MVKIDKKLIKTVNTLLNKTFKKKLDYKVVKPYSLSKFDSPTKKEVFKNPKVQRELRKFSQQYHIFYSGKVLYGFLVEKKYENADELLKKLDKLGVKNLLIGELKDGVILFEFIE